MAGKIIVTVTILFFLFTFGYARTPLDLPENDVMSIDALLPESNPKATDAILLPSEKPTVVEFEPETETKLPEIDTAEETKETEIDSAPLKFVSFRPINRHFPRRPFPPFRHGSRCRHHHKIKPWAPRFNGREIPYGNDMILSGGEDVVWTEFHHGGPKFSFMNDVDRREEMKRPHHRHHHHHDRLVAGEVEEKEEREQEHEHEHHHHHHDRLVEGEREVEEKRERKHDDEHEGGLVKVFRKFLPHFWGYAESIMVIHLIYVCGFLFLFLLL